VFHPASISLNESGVSVKRICLLAFAAAGLLNIGVAAATAAAPHASTEAAKSGTKSKSKLPTTKVSCKLSLTIQVPAGATTVTEGSTTGTELGSAGCGAPLGSGLETLSFATADDGSLSGSWQQYFDAGTVWGAYTLTPSNNGQPPSTTTFTTSSYMGTFTVKNGAGADAHVTGTGRLNCTTTDGVHFSCTEVAKLLVPAKS